MTTAHTTDSLTAITTAELRSIYQTVIGKKAVAKSRQYMIAAILAAQTEANDNQGDDDQDDEPEVVVDTDTQGTDDGNQEPEVVNTDNQATDDQKPDVANKATAGDPDPKVTMVDTAAVDPEPTDATSQEPEVTEPIKVKVLGTGSMEGSTLACDLLALGPLIVEVQVMTDRIRFRVDDGEPVRTKKAWGAGGWRLDVSTLPEVPEPTIEDAAVSASALSVRQLQEIYEKVVQRPTKSSNRGYLAWRIREASKGRLPTGTRRARGTGEPVKVVPLGMPVSTVEALDAAWRRCGYGSRIAFIRSAMSRLLVELGEDDVAGMVER